MSLSLEIVTRLKQILRTKGLSYRALADGLGMSEAAMKRAFSERAFSLKRLEEICAFLKISTRDLLESEGEGETLPRVLSEEQELMLSSDKKLMCFFYLIASKQSLSEIRVRYKFSEEEIGRFLLALDRGKLIRLDAGNRFKLLVEQDFCWRKGGLLDAYYMKEIRRDFFEHDFDGPREFEAFAAGLMSDASLELIRKRLYVFEEELRELIRLDTKYRDRKLSNVSFYFSFRPWALPLMKKYRREV